MHRKCTVRVYVMRGDNLAESPSAKQNKLDNRSNSCTKPTNLSALKIFIKQITEHKILRPNTEEKWGIACSSLPEKTKKSIC